MNPGAVTCVVAGMGILALLAGGCEGNGYEEGPGTETGAMSPPFGGPDDLARADRLWQTMRGYQDNWSAYPGFEGWQDGRSPHGRYLKYYANATAAGNPQDPGYGSIIVKENYPEKDAGKLGPVTVMQKIRGYDPENADWFWVKFAPDGSVMTNPKGMHLAGRVAKGMDQGCIACHGNARGNDYLFVNDG